jgi:hypothetical protein
MSLHCSKPLVVCGSDRCNAPMTPFHFAHFSFPIIFQQHSLHKRLNFPIQISRHVVRFFRDRIAANSGSSSGPSSSSKRRTKSIIGSRQSPSSKLLLSTKPVSGSPPSSAWPNPHSDSSRSDVHRNDNANARRLGCEM